MSTKQQKAVRLFKQLISNGNPAIVELEELQEWLDEDPNALQLMLEWLGSTIEDRIYEK